MKKWRRGKGTMLTASFLKSELSWPGKRRQVVTPDMTAETRWLRSPYEGELSLRVLMQMSYKASLSIQKVSSEFSTIDNISLNQIRRTDASKIAYQAGERRG